MFYKLKNTVKVVWYGYQLSLKNFSIGTLRPRNCSILLFAGLSYISESDSSPRPLSSAAASLSFSEFPFSLSP
jgi:hypothetical protein